MQEITKHDLQPAKTGPVGNLILGLNLNVLLDCKV